MKTDRRSKDSRILNELPLSDLFELDEKSGRVRKLKDQLDKKMSSGKDSSIRNLQNANNAEIALCGQLMLVTTVILTGVGLILTDTKAIDGMTNMSKQIVIAGVLLLMSSIAAGIIYYFHIKKYHEAWAFAEHEVFEYYDNADFGKITYQDLLDKIDGSRKGLTFVMSPAWLYVQVGLLGLGAITYLLYGISILFN